MADHDILGAQAELRQALLNGGDMPDLREPDQAELDALSAEQLHDYRAALAHNGALIMAALAGLRRARRSALNLASSYTAKGERQSLASRASIEVRR